jgi:hypothetical protein
VYLDAADRLRDVYILGATGAGKTRRILRLIESDLAGACFLSAIQTKSASS